MVQTFEEYCDVSSVSPAFLKKMQSVAEVENFLVLLYNMYINHLQDKRGIYTDMYVAIKCLSYTHPDNSHLKTLIKGMYELDELCGIEEKLFPTQSKEEQLKILEKLDADREKFKNYLKNTHFESPDSIYKKLFLLFARLLFTFNGYQAPVRSNINQAVKDSAGLTDLFSELLREL